MTEQAPLSPDDIDGPDAPGDVGALAEAFFTAWNIPESVVRRGALRALVTDAVTYADPHQPELVSGCEAYLALSDAFHVALPGAAFEPRRAACHHGVAKLPFILRAADGAEISRGAFICTLDPSWRITSLAAFADEP